MSSLTTITLVQSHLGISNDDTIIGTIVDGVNAGLDNYFGTTFNSTVYTNEEYDMAKDSRVLKLNNRPVTSFSSLQYKNNPADYSDTSWTSYSTGEYVVDLKAGLVTKNSDFIKGKRMYRATYTAGYATIPDGLKLAATILASSMYQNRKNANVTSETLGQYSRTFALNPTSWKQLGIDWILNKYKMQNVNWFDNAWSEKGTSNREWDA